MRPLLPTGVLQYKPGADAAWIVLCSTRGEDNSSSIFPCFELKKSFKKIDDLMIIFANFPPNTLIFLKFLLVKMSRKMF